MLIQTGDVILFSGRSTYETRNGTEGNDTDYTEQEYRRLARKTHLYLLPMMLLSIVLPLLIVCKGILVIPSLSICIILYNYDNMFEMVYMRVEVSSLATAS